MSSTDDAVIVDRGYRRFEGVRRGVAGGVRSVAWHTTRSILGLGRPARHKIFPVLIVVLAFVPAVIFFGVLLIVADVFGDEFQQEYWELIAWSLIQVLLFVALVTPEALVRDRRNGMLALYLSTPLTRSTYLLAKVIAVVGVMAIILIGPPLLLLVGYTFQGVGPDGVVEWIVTALRIFASGGVILAVWTAVGMAAATVTDRRAFASVAAIMALFGTNIVMGILVGETETLGPNWWVLDPVGLPVGLAPRIFGAVDTESGSIAAVPTWLLGLGCVGWTAAGAAIVGFRYRRMAVI